MSIRHRPSRLALVPTTVLLVAGALAACGDDDASDEVSTDPASSGASPAGDADEPGGPASLTVEVVEADGSYSFDLPETVEAGATRITLVNEGAEEHHAQLFKLNPGATVQDLSGALASGDPVAALEFGVFDGGTSVVGPGETSQADAVVDLTEGTWAMLCFIESPDGVPHLAKGMLQPFEVVASDEPAELPEVDAEFTLLDYGYSGPESVPGDAVLELTNASDAEPHEMVIARLDDGATVDDVVGALTEESEPPMTPVGGLQAILPGAGQLVQLDLDPGEYVVACGIPSVIDGVPHLAKGMVRTLTVT